MTNKNYDKNASRHRHITMQKECVSCHESFRVIGYNPKLRKYCNNGCKVFKEKICMKCKILKNVDDFGPNNSQPDKMQTYCKECRKPWAKERYQKNKEYLGEQGARNRFKIRLEILKKLGSKCVKCGDSNLYHLQIDHKFDDGKTDRKSHTRLTTMIKKYLDGIYDINRLQCLCSNCNIEKQLRKYKFLPKLIEEYGF